MPLLPTKAIGTTPSRLLSSSSNESLTTGAASGDLTTWERVRPGMKEGGEEGGCSSPESSGVSSPPVPLQCVGGSSGGLLLPGELSDFVVC